MRRREFLAASSGAALAPLAPGLASASSCADPPWKWVKMHPPPSSEDLGYCVGSTIYRIPEVGQGYIEFSPPACAKPMPRPLWSELKLRRNWIKACRVADDLKRGYDKLLNWSNDDPRSLLYQAWIHAFYCGNGWRDVHETWDFLPWHRAFVYFHERILARACGNPHFRMPVWDWETEIDLPEFYIKLGLPSFLKGNYGREPDPEKKYVCECVLQQWLFSKTFEDFCGTCDVNSALKSAGPPHSSIHDPVVRGAMHRAITAAADPIFYSHHANVDRFFRFWLNYYKSFKRPGCWLNRSYFLYDENRQLVRVRTWQLLNECQLGYTYNKDPKVELSGLAPFPVTAKLWNDPVALLKELAAIMLGTIALRQEPVQNLGPIVETILSCNADSRLPALPVKILAKLPRESIADGTYYPVVVETERNPEYLGSFTLFSHHHQEAAPPSDKTRVLIIGCLGWKIINLLCGGKQLHIKYGNPGPERPVISFDTDDKDVQDFEVLYRPAARDLGKALLNKFGAHF